MYSIFDRCNCIISVIYITVVGMMSGISLAMTVINQRIASTEPSEPLPTLARLILGIKTYPDDLKFNPWRKLATKCDWFCFVFLLSFVSLSTLTVLLILLL